MISISRSKRATAAGLAHRCTVEVAYVIGHRKPICISVDSYGTGVLPDEKLTNVVNAEFDLSPSGIIEELDLRRPIFSHTAVYGHFGRTGEGFSWENLDRVDDLRKYRPSRRKSTRSKAAKAKGGK